jgi:hypothetical protein
MFSQVIAFIPFGFAVLYAVYGGIENGLPLLAFSRDRRLRPALKRAARWEVSLVLLGMSVVTGALLYSRAVTFMTQSIWLVMFFIAALLILRVVLLALAGAGLASGDHTRTVQAVIGLALPALLMQVVVVMLTSDGYLMDHPELVVSLGVGGILATAAVAGGFFYQPGTIAREVARRSYLAAAVWWAVPVPLALFLNPAILDGRSLFGLAWPAMLAIGAGMFILMWPDRRRYFIASATLIAGVAFMLFNIISPYLVRPVLLLTEASSNPYTQLEVMALTAVSFFIVFPFLEHMHTWATKES